MALGPDGDPSGEALLIAFLLLAPALILTENDEKCEEGGGAVASVVLSGVLVLASGAGLLARGAGEIAIGLVPFPKLFRFAAAAVGCAVAGCC